MWFTRHRMGYFAGLMMVLAASSARADTDPINGLALYTDDYPPYNFIEGDEVKGISVDLLLEILGHAGSSLKRTDVRLLPWARGYEYAKRDENTLLFAMTRTEEREDLFQWVGPIARSNMVLVARKSDQIIIEKPDDLRAYELGAVREDIGEPLLRDLLGADIDIHLANHGLQCAKMLELGRIQLWSYEENVAFWFIRQAGFNPADYEVVYTIGRAEEWFAVSNKTDPAIVKRLQDALDALGDETRQKIIRRYTGAGLIN